MTFLPRPLLGYITGPNGVPTGWGVVCLLLLLVSCATPGTRVESDVSRSAARGQSAATTAQAGGSVAADRDLAVARRMVNTGEFSLVIPRLQQVITKFPGAQAGIDARYYLGRSYFAVGAYNDALRYLTEYLELAPDGEHVESGRDYVARLTVRTEESDLPEFEVQVASLREVISASPDDMAPRLELANLFWEEGRYNEAGAEYEELLARWPRLEEDMAVRRRIERAPTGAITILTPDEVERRYREEEPLMIYNVSAFRSGRFEGWPTTARERYYNVTGQAVNQSSQTLRDVRIITTIYGFGHMVYDTQTVNLGALRPGEVRAFSVQFSRFDDVHNITRHECVGTFQR